MEDQWDYDELTLIKYEGLVLALHAYFFIVQTYYCIKAFNADFIIRYGPTYFGTIYLLTTLICPFIYEDLVRYYVMAQRRIFLNIERANLETRRKIMLFSKVTKYVLIVNLVIAYATLVTFLMRGKNEREIFFPFSYIRENYHGYIRTILLGLFYVTFPICPYVMIMGCYLFVYFSLGGAFQVFIINDMIAEVSGGFISRYEFDMYDDRYQAQIRKRLICLARHHIVLKRLATQEINSGKNPVIWYYFTGMLVVFGTLGNYYLNPVTFYPRIIGFGMNGAYFIIVMATVGQVGTDSSINGYDFLLDLPWYNWNFENQKIFLIIVMHSMKPLTLSQYQAVALNNELYVQIYKITTTMAAFLACMAQLHHIK